MLDLNADEIADDLTDGHMDCGIDAIHISGREVSVFSFKYATTFEQSKKNFPDNLS